MPRVSLKLDEYHSRSLPFRSNLKKCLIKRHFILLFSTRNRKKLASKCFFFNIYRLTQTKHDPMPPFRILPLYILVRAPDSAASALMTALVPNMRPDLFPLIHLSWTEDRTDFIRTVVQTNIAHYFITFHARYASRANLSFSPAVHTSRNIRITSLKDRLVK
jgi:hypothetical protein